MRVHHYFVYILANTNRTIYVGVTNNLTRRIQEHKSHSIPGFTAKYKISKLVYYEEFSYIPEAIQREKQLKGYDRASKIHIVEGINPAWEDLASDWF